jgi:bifunctional oligoribonuclease and PAP phosphatase NrnA
MSYGEFDLRRIREILNAGSQTVLILTHRNPDGDAIGASMALYNLLSKMGHKTNVIVPNSVPAFLQWMPNAEKIVNYTKMPEKANALLTEASLMFSLDFNDISRIREFESQHAANKAYKVLIDHHPNPESFCDLIISDTRVSSTCELLFSFIRSLDLDHLVDQDIAACLYAGIMTDTGCFSFNSSLPETFEMISDLLAFGFDKDKIYDQVYNNYSFDRMKLMGYCLDKKMQVLPEYRTAYISLTQEEMRQYNFRIGDSEGFVNLPLSIAGIRFSVLFIENKELVRVSFRSKGSFKVNRLAAEHFKGGGHNNAAGGESYDTMQNTIAKFLSLLPEYKNELQAD